MDQRGELARQVAEGFSKAARLRTQSRQRFGAARVAVRQGQREKLQALHASALTHPSTASAAAFFFSDIYPEHTQPWRDALARSALPSLSKLLPLDALMALAAAAALDEATEEADCASAAAWDGSSWERAYMAAGQGARERQIQALLDAGERLGEMSSNRLARPALAAMRLPARLAGLGELQSFLERGLAAFESLPDPADFARELAGRELAWSRALFGALGAPKP